MLRLLPRLVMIWPIAALATEAADALSVAHSRWHLAAPHSYTYSIDMSSAVRTSCTVYYPARVSIEAGSIARIVSLNDKHRGQDVPHSCFKYFYTIDAIFEYLEAHKDVQGKNGPCIRATYNYEYGYPTMVEDTCVLDGDFPITIELFSGP